MNEMFFEEQQREELRDVDKEIRRRKIIHGEICPYCLQKPELVNTTRIYGELTNVEYGMFYYCHDCQAWVGVHKKDNTPLGRLANKELRALKREAHMYFDKIWEPLVTPSFNKGKARTWAYDWLSEKMGIRRDETHIGMFDEDQCRNVIYYSQQMLINGPENRRGDNTDI